MGFLSSIGKIAGTAIGAYFGGPTGAAIGGKIGGGLGGAGDNAISGSQAKSVANTQAQGADAATALQARMYDQTRADHTPYLNTGVAANNQLGYLMGLSPGSAGGSDPMTGVNTALGASGSLAKPFSVDDFHVDPGYQFALDQGQKALQNSAAAKGGLFSGATGKAINEYAQGVANQQYSTAYDRYNTNQNNLYSRLAGLSNSGQGAANMVGAAGAESAKNSSQSLQDAAQIRAAGQKNMTNAWNTGLGQFGSALGSIWGG